MFDFRDLIVAAGTSFVVSAFGTWYVTHRIDGARFDRAKTVAAEETSKALMQALDDQRDMLDKEHAIAMNEVLLQRVVATKIVTVTKEIEIHVPIDVPCPSVGFVRVLDAAAAGAASVDDLSLPGGVADGSCAPTDYRSLAKIIVGNYGLYHALATKHASLAEAVAVRPTSARDRPH